MAHVFRSSLENARRKAAEIEVASLSLGDQVEAEWLPLHGITYDPNDDLVEVALEGLDYMIRKPREIYLEDWTRGLTTIEVVDADGTKQVVKLREPLMLASPGRNAGTALLHTGLSPGADEPPFTEPRVAVHYFGRSVGSDNPSCTALIRLGPPKAVDIDCVDARSATTRTEKFRLASSSQPTRK
jgi:hypothetical protein